MKAFKKNFKAVISVFIVAAAILANFIFLPNVFAAETNPSNGDIENSPLSNGTGTNGDVKFTKTVSKTEDEGVFKVTLTAKGNDVTTTTTQEVPIYIALVLDTSGSMPDSHAFGPKYTNAKNAIESFSNEVLKSNRYPNAKIGLYTFNDSASELRGFDNSPIPASSSVYPTIKNYWQTHMHEGINLAAQKLREASASDENAKLYMIVLSDGRPEFDGATSGQAFQLAKEAATEAKKDIEIFTVGYALKDTEAVDLLENYIATDPSHAITAEINNTTEGSADGIVAKLTNLVNNITIPMHVGTANYIEDVIASNFEYVEGSANPSDVTLSNNNKKIRFNNLGDITSSGIEVSFKIRIKENTINKPAWYKTNDNAQINYNDATGSNNTKTIGDSPKVFWGLAYYPYTVKYLEQGTNKELLSPTTVNDIVLGSQITANAEVITGYNVDAESKTITITSGTNEIVFYYTKKNNLNYVVEYYVEENAESTIKYSNDNDGNIYGGQTFGEDVYFTEINKDKYLSDIGFGYKSGTIIFPANTDKITIKETDNLIKVCHYRRDDLTYTVKYLEEGTNKELHAPKTEGNKTFNETYKEQAIEIDGYTVDKDEKSVKISAETNEIIFYYSKRTNLSYTVKYLEEGTNKEMHPPKTETNKTFDQTYTEDAVAIDGYAVDKNQKTVKVGTGTNEIVFYYTKRTDLTYTVKYLEQGTNKQLADPKTETNKTFDQTYTEDAVAIDGYTVDKDQKTVKVGTGTNEIVFYYTKRTDLGYTVKYVEEGTDDEVSTIKTETGKTFGETYVETAKIIKGYTVDKSEKSVTITTGTNEITFYYTKKSDLKYRVEYYYDGEIDSSKTEYFEGFEYGTVISTYTEKLPEGYIFYEDTSPITIDDEADNVIRVYYISTAEGDIQPPAPNTGIAETNALSTLYFVGSMLLIALYRKENESNN